MAIAVGLKRDNQIEMVCGDGDAIELLSVDDAEFLVLLLTKCITEIERRTKNAQEPRACKVKYPLTYGDEVDRS